MRESHKQALVGGSCGECAEASSELRCKPHLSVSHASMCSEVDGNESSLQCPGLLGVWLGWISKSPLIISCQLWTLGCQPGGDFPGG